MGAMLLLLFLPGLALAQGAGGPPPAAFAACAGIQSGGNCQFSAPHGTVAGTCRIMGEGRPVCVPGHAGGGPRPEKAQPTGASPFGATLAAESAAAQRVSSGIPDTRQGDCFDNQGKIPCPKAGQDFYGQDAHYAGAIATYRDNRDGTLSDTVTGLQWEKAHHDTRLSYYQAEAACQQLQLGGYRDWRLPSIKELFSLADFRGAMGRRPYLDEAFEFRQPGQEVLEGDRFASTHTPAMMGQTWSATKYTGVHFGRPGVEAAFFFNFLDGHIKQAPTRGKNKLFYRCVRGGPWGDNRFVPRGKDLVADQASGLLWQRADDGRPRDWQEALAYCQSLTLAGLRDWRLPNIKELQSIVDYTRHAPALDQRHFTLSDPKAWFWSSTTHGDNIRHGAYICFGPCTSVDGVDVHGAGAQRSSPKTGNPADYGALGSQRDEVRTRNYVRCVRSAS